MASINYGLWHKNCLRNHCITQRLYISKEILRLSAFFQAQSFLLDCNKVHSMHWISVNTIYLQFRDVPCSHVFVLFVCSCGQFQSSIHCCVRTGTYGRQVLKRCLSNPYEWGFNSGSLTYNQWQPQIPVERIFIWHIMVTASCPSIIELHFLFQPFQNRVR